MKEEKIIEKARALLETGKYEKLVKSSHVAVIGAGGAGCNTVARMMDGLSDMEGVDTILINSDSAELMEQGKATKKVLIGKNLNGGKGGAGGKRSVARKMVENARESLEVLIKPYQLLVMVGGLGGGTGTELMIQLSRMASDSGKVVVAVPFLPFRAEGSRRSRAEKALAELRETGATVIPMDNDSLTAMPAGMSLEDAFGLQARVIQKKVKELNESVRRAILNEIMADIEAQIMAEEAVQQAAQPEVLVSVSIDGNDGMAPPAPVEMGLEPLVAGGNPQLMDMSEKEDDVPPGAS